ncbi:MAG: PorT family protein [Bacteroidetes bacterium]|nr:PorT family protein [Bacteroidota bacterium]MBS1541175.1 PorT family protein [Bacteroidota bacterium]
MNAKVLVLTLIGMVLLINISEAQKQIDFGVKGGLNISGLDLSQIGKLVGVSYNVRQGYHFGIYAQARRKNLALQPELIFSNQGQNFTTPYYSNLYTQLNYIQLPVMVKYYLTGGLYVQAGPQISRLTGANGYIMPVDNQGNVGQPTVADLKRYIHQYDFSFGFGAGLELPFGGGISFRYTNGISDINKYSGSTSFPTNGQGQVLTHSLSTSYARNQVFQISLTYKIEKLKIKLEK